MIAILIISPCYSFPQKKMIEVSVNTNVETIAILFNLTAKGASQHYGYGSPIMRKEIMNRFSHLSNHTAVTITVDFLDKGAWATPLWIAINCSPFPDGKLTQELLPWVYMTASQTNDIEDGKRQVNDYIKAVNDFYKAAELDNFFEENQSYYNMVENQVRKNLPDKGFVQLMEYYYGKEHARYTLVPSPAMLEFSGIGAAAFTENGVEVFNIFGASLNRVVKDSIEAGKRDFSPGDFTFDVPERIRELTVHEFGHAFINPVAEQYRDQINQYSYLYNPIKDEMTKLSYLNWWDCAVEHFVRAGEIKIAKAIGNEENAQRLMQEYIQTYYFLYLPEILNALEKYDENRSIYSNIDDFFSELISAFKDVDSNVALKRIYNK
jgi:hypothetical protein